ncbi:MAG: hypothetical protein V2B14_03160, partial [bacterium]
NIPKPLSSQEMGFLVGNIFVEIIKLRFSPVSLNKNFFLISIFLKMLKYRHRLKATILEQFAKYVYKF